MRASRLGPFVLVLGALVALPTLSACSDDSPAPADTATKAGDGGGGGGDTGGGGSSDGAPAGDSAASGDASKPAKYTYWRDVKPIVDAKCTGCHRAGGIGPFPLTSYAAVKTAAPMARAAVFDQRMPPWHADRKCTTYKHDASLTDAQRQTILDWIDSGMPEGDPKTEGKALPGPPTLTSVDVSLKMKAAYTMQQTPDEYRCFVLDWPYKTDKFITGFNVKAGNKKIAHHMIAYLAQSAKDVSRVTSKAANDPKPGYACFGNPGFGDALTTPWLGAWAPGTGAINFPAGTGIPVKPGAKIVIQMHYNADTTGGGTDQSTIEFSVADTATKARLQPLTNPLWLSGSFMHIPAGKDNVKHEFTIDPTVFTGGKAITMYNVMMHMHYLGKSAFLGINHKDGTKDCMINIPRWDFNWQRFYTFTGPKVLKSGDTMTIRCVYNNTAANQPVIQGKKVQPRDVAWGEGTRDEMCLAVVYMLDPF